MDVTAKAAAVRHLFGDAAKHLQSDGFFDVVVSVDGRGNGPGDFSVDTGVGCHLFDDRFVLFGDVDLFELFDGDFYGVAFDEEVEDGAFLAADNPLDAAENAVDDDPVARGDDAAEVVDDVDVDVLRLFAAPQAFGGFLNSEFLGVDEGGFDRDKFQFFLGTFGMAADVGFCVGSVVRGCVGEVAVGAAEGAYDQSRPDSCYSPDDAVDADEFVDVLGTDVTDEGFPGKADEPDVYSVDKFFCGVVSFFVFAGEKMV